MATSFNIFDASLKADPLPVFSELAVKPPFIEKLFGVDSLILCRFRDVETGYSDYQRFSNVKPYIPGQESIDYFKGKTIFAFTDPPEHTKLRRNIATTVSPRAIHSLKGDIETLLESALEKLDRSRDDIEVMDNFCHPLAVDVILGVLLGLPKQDFAIFKTLTAEICNLGALQPGDKHPLSYDRAWDQADRYLRDVIAGKNERIDREKIIWKLVTLNREDGELDSEELLLQIMPLCVAGISPLSSFLGSVLLMMARYPGQYQKLCEQPGLVDNAIEEILRFDPPSMFSPRYAKGDFSFEGVPVSDGMPVYLIVGAIGFDPTVYPDPEQFDISRPAPSHVVFGRGHHMCLGMHLVRLLGRLLLPRLCQRYRAIDLLNPDGRVAYGGSPQARDPLALHLRFIP